jgi:hypothetical protein
MFSSLQPSRPKVDICLDSNPQLAYSYPTGLRSTNPKPKPHAPTTDPHSISINILTTEKPRTQKSNGSNATKPDAYQSINATPDLQSRHRPPSLLLRSVAKSPIPYASDCWVQSRRDRLRLREQKDHRPPTSIHQAVIDSWKSCAWISRIPAPAISPTYSICPSSNRSISRSSPRSNIRATSLCHLISIQSRHMMQAPSFSRLKNSWKQGSQHASDHASFVSGMGHRIASTSSKKPKALAVLSAISQVVGWYSEWPHASRISMMRHMILLRVLRVCYQRVWCAEKRLLPLS